MQTKSQKIVGRAPERQAGMTLVELLIVLAIAAVLATIAAPSFSSFVNDTRLTTTLSQLASDLNRARLDAIKRNSWVLFCVRDAAGTGCSTGTDWNNGWVICHDSEPDGDCDAATDEEPNPIVIRQALKSKLSLTGPTAAIRFNPNGTQGTGTVATLTLCCKSNKTTGEIVRVAATGHISK